MIDLLSYCADEDDPRDYLHIPFLRENEMCATNGSVLIMVPELAWTGPFRVRNTPDMDQLMYNFDKDLSFLALQDLQPSKPKSTYVAQYSKKATFTSAITLQHQHILLEVDTQQLQKFQFLHDVSFALQGNDKPVVVRFAEGRGLLMPLMPLQAD